MPQLPEELWKRIESGTATAADLQCLRQMLVNPDAQIAQLGKYNIQVKEGREIHIGDRTYVEINEAAIEAIVAAVQRQSAALRSGDLDAARVQRYLQSILNNEDYCEWQEVYTLTLVEDRKQLHRINRAESPQPKFSSRLKLWVETVKPPEAEKQSTKVTDRQEQVEQLDVLAGLRKYAAEHVLLIGKPGSGKSTSLERLLWEEADQALKHATNAKIPVLVKLRRCTGTIEALIQDFCRSHQLSLTLAEIEMLLDQGKLLLLLDGLNELPEAFRTNVANFRDRYRATTPMIVSTRELSIGGNLGITKTLKMLPLTEPQMQEFVQGYLGQEGNRLFQQLKGDRLRKFAETPLLLWMLCRVFAQKGQVPENLGLAFREFTQLYDEDIQQDAPADSRDQWPKLLRHLAFALMHDREPTDFRLSMPKEEAEDLLTTCLQQEGRANARDCAERWLKDLLSYHLIQPVIQPNYEKHIEFRHQLIQEYYAAEAILNGQQELIDLVAHIYEPKWQEIVLLVVELKDNSDDLVRLIKAKLDNFLAEHKKLRQLLTWANQKASYIGVSENLGNLNGVSSLNYSKFQASVRAFYCTNSLTYALNLNRPIERIGARANEFLVSLNPSFSLDLVSAAALDHEHRYGLNYYLVRDRALVSIVDFAQDLNQKLSLDPNFYLGSVFIRTLASLLNDILTNNLIPWDLDSELETSLWILKRELSGLNSNSLNQWTHKLRCVLKNHQVIFGKSVDFSEDEANKIESFFRVNKLLVECLKKARGLTQDLKEEILSSLLVE